MNLTTGVIVGALVLIAIGGGIFVSMSDKNDAMAEKAKIEKTAMEEQKMIEEKMMTEKEAQMKKDEAMKDDEGMMEKEDSVMMNDDAVMEKEDVMVKSEELSMMKKEDVMAKVGSYEAYAPEKVALASASHDVILFFRASWCPSCRAIDADIKANIGVIPANLSILDVNYDDATALKQKYGVTYQHTFVQVDASGTLIKKWSGTPTLSALVKEVQ
jgi:thioredoxin 1